MAHSTTDRRRFLKLAKRDVRQLRSERVLWANALAELVQSQIDYLSGHIEFVAPCLRQAIEMLTRADLCLAAASAKRELGKLVGGDEGRLLVSEAETWMKDQQIVSPRRMSRLMLPGFVD